MTLPLTPAPCALCIGSRRSHSPPPRIKLVPLEGRERLGRNLLLNGGFIPASWSRAPCQGHAHIPSLWLTRGAGIRQDKEVCGLHIPPCPGPSCPRVSGFPPCLLLSRSFPCSLAKPRSRTIGKVEGYLLTDNLPTYRSRPFSPV